MAADAANWPQNVANVGANGTASLDPHERDDGEASPATRPEAAGSEGRQEREPPSPTDSQCGSEVSSDHPICTDFGTDYLPIFYSNITEFGPQFLRFLKHTRYHILLIAEHHLSKARLAEEAAKLKALGWRIAASPAACAGRSKEGASGGTMCLVRSHIACNDPYDQHDTYGDDWCVISLRLKGVNLDVYVIYLTDGLGYTGANVAKLAGLAASIKKRPNEFFILGDFNMTVKDLAACGWPSLIGAHLFDAHDATFTCRTGMRVIDFGLCSR